MVRDLPTGVVTLVFTDVEGSTRLLRELGDDYGEALHEHRRRLRAAFADHEGIEVDTQGDAFFVAFARASDAVAAAADSQRALADGPIHVRMYRRRRPRRAGAPVADNACARRRERPRPGRAPPQGSQRPGAHLPARD